MLLFSTVQFLYYRQNLQQKILLHINNSKPLILGINLSFIPKKMQIYDQDYFQSQFEKNFLNLGAQCYNKYQPILKNYKQHIIPFQKKRMVENQSLIFQNSTLQKDKMELRSKIQRLSAQNSRHQELIESQSHKINDLGRKCEALEMCKKDNEKLITDISVHIQQLEVSLNMKIQTIKVVEQDKQQLCKKYEQRNNQFNILLSNYMRDKNEMAEKLNQMNQLEQKVLDKEKELKAEQFYLKKQWEQLDEQKKIDEQKKKGSNQKIPSIIPDREFKKRTSIHVEDQGKQKDEKKKLEGHAREVLKNPIKKIYKYHQSEIYSLSFNYNGSLLASCGGDRCIKIFDTLNMRQGITIQSNSAENIVLSSVLNYGGQKVLAGGTDKKVTIYSSSTGKQLHSFVGHGQKVNSVTWSSSRQKCASGSEDRQIKIWQIQKTVNSLSISCGKSVKYVTANTVEPVIYSGHSDGSVRIYSMTQGKLPIAQIKGIIDYPINCISLLSNRYQALISSSEGSIIHLIDMKMNKSIGKFEHPDFFNTSVQADISPSETYCVAGNCDGSIYYWNTIKKIFEKRISGHQGPINTLKYNFMSGVLASADKQGNLIIWQ